jgi:hypothetical protein
MTRPRDRLYVTFPLRYYHRKHARGNAHSHAQLSRFIPPELFPRFERTGYSFAEEVSAPMPTATDPVGEEVRDRLRRLWG